MATLKDISNRIKAVKGTQQITKAMKMVAASKLRKVQQRMLELRSYADKMRAVTQSLASGADEQAHPLLSQRPRKTVEVLVLTSDRGLCGAFNTNVMKAAVALTSTLEQETSEDTISTDGLEVQNSAVGKKALAYYKRRSIDVRQSWTGISGALSYEDAQKIAADIIEQYVDGKVDEVHVVYNEFVNMGSQKVKTVRLLPASELVGEEEEAGASADFIYEPGKEELLEALLPKNIETQVYRALLESSASEEAARMSAMENATKSATEMIDTLTLQYNKARQASITGELMDIVGGVEALK